MKKLFRLSGIPQIFLKLLLILWCCFIVFSLSWIATSSLKTNNEFFSNRWGFFKTPHIENYYNIFNVYRIGRYFANSIFLVSLSVLGIVAVASPAAYVLARVRFPFRSVAAGSFSLGMGVPVQLLLIPLYFILYDLKMLNSLLGLAIPYVSLSLPFSIFLMIGFFKSLPRELEDAAYVDGCTPMMCFFRIMLPIGKTGAITCAIFNFVGLWNEFLMSLTMISSSKLYTLPIGLYEIQGAMTYAGDWTGLFAGFTMAIVPLLIVYMFLSKHIIAGLTAGAIKG